MSSPDKSTRKPWLDGLRGELIRLLGAALVAFAASAMTSHEKQATFDEKVSDLVDRTGRIETRVDNIYTLMIKAKQ